MSQNSCCVPRCAVVRKDGVPLHLFPNPETSAEKFNTWILNIGGEIAVLDHHTIYSNRRVCHRHFEEIHKYQTGRLSKLAIPTLHIPDLQAQSLGETMVISTPDISQQSDQQTDFNKSGKELIEAVINTPALASTNIEAILSKPALASTSHVLMTQSNNFISGHQNVVLPDQPQCRERKSKKTTNSKSPRVSLAQHKEFKSVLKKLRKCERDKNNFKAKYMIAKKMKYTTAFNIVCKNMSPTTKLFCQMQASQSGKKKKGRRFTLDEKFLALSLYKPSPKAYRLLSKVCVLPSRRTLQNLLHKVESKSWNQ